MSRFFETTHGIYFDDLDPFAILHNARYVLLFERALGAFWMHVGWGGFQDESSPEQFHLVRSNHVDYLAPVRGVGQVRIRVFIAHLGASSLRFRFLMMPLDRDVPYAEGHRTIIHVDPRTLRPKPWTDGFKDVMNPWVEAPQAP